MDTSSDLSKLLQLSTAIENAQSFLLKQTECDGYVFLGSDEYKILVPLYMERFNKQDFLKARSMTIRVMDDMVDQYEKKELEDAKKKGSVVFPTLKSLIGKKKHTSFCRFRILDQLQKKYHFEGNKVTTVLREKADEFPITFYMSKEEADKEGVSAFWAPPPPADAAPVSVADTDTVAAAQTD